MSKISKIKRTAKWIAPVVIDLDEQLESALKRRDIRTAYKNYKGSPEDFKRELKDYLEQVNKENKNLRRFASYLDIVNKGTVPLDAALDYLNIMAGVGYAARAIETVAKAPGYLAYDAYYLGKTGDLTGALGNIAYEIGSWASLGALPHLINWYTRKVDKQTLNKATERFLKGLEKKIIDITPKKQTRKEDLEELARAA